MRGRARLGGESVVDDPFRWQTTTHGALLKYKAAWEAGFSVPSQAVGPRSARGSSHLVFCLHTVKSGTHQNSMPPSDFSPSHRPTRQYIHTTDIGLGRTFVYDLLRILLPNRHFPLIPVRLHKVPSGLAYLMASVSIVLQM